MNLWRTISLCLGFLCCVTAEDYPTFEEGAVNATIQVGAVVSEVKKLRCTVKDPGTSTDLNELEMLPPPESGDNWKIDKNMDEKWIEVTINGVNEGNKGKTFICTAINSDNKSSELSYHVETVYQGTTFEEGTVNATLKTDLTSGVKAEIRCTVKSADPAIDQLDIIPLPPISTIDYKVIGEDKKWIGIEFININSNTPTAFTCSAISNVTTANLHYSVSVFDGIKFVEGSTNGSVNYTLVTETTSSVRCTIASADPELRELSVLPVPEPGNEDYKIIKNETYWVEIEFLHINYKTPTDFVCIAENNITTASLNYAMAVTDPVPPVFSFGGNDTIWQEIKTGDNYTIFCDVKPNVALPAVTELTAEPPESPDGNWKIVTKGTSSIEIQITGADPSKNKRDFICIAGNGVRTTTLIFQTYAGGPPTAVDANLDAVVNNDKVELSLTITDRSDAPAQHILVFLEGVTTGNLTLNSPRPENYDDEVGYTFSKFLKASVSAVRANPRVKIYANNSLGEAYVKEIGIAVPKQSSKSSSKSGEIAAGILVPFFVILGALVIGGVVYYFWKKGRKPSIGFSRIGGSAPADHVEDAKTTYGAL